MSTEIIDQFFTTEPWVARSACSGSAPELFFPERGASVAPARAICSTCPVREECLDYALRTSQKYGIWGGFSERERRTMRRVRRAALGLGAYGPLARLPDDDVA